MASISRPLLTIAIPTYNRANLLELSLSKILEALKGFEKDVEIVISNNCSEDNTELIIKNAQKFYPIKYYVNSENIGFNFNYIKLIDEYVTGRYCWVLGDDDFLYPNAIKEIISVLKNHQDLSFINLKFDFKSLEKLSLKSESIYLKSNIQSISIPGRCLTFNQLISTEGVPGNLMFTFISSVIFKTDLMKALDKSEIEKESWNSFYNCFPHSYFYAKIMKDRMAYVFDSPLITAIVHEKVWNSKMWLLYLKFIPELHNHYFKNGFSKKDLINQKKLIIRAGIPYLFLNIFSSITSLKIKILFFLNYVSDLYFYFSLINILKEKIFKSITKKLI
jgi:glycosyltransferase involved in cell wall biosynthesis